MFLGIEGNLDNVGGDGGRDSDDEIELNGRFGSCRSASTPSRREHFFNRVFERRDLSYNLLHNQSRLLQDFSCGTIEN